MCDWCLNPLTKHFSNSICATAAEAVNAIGQLSQSPIAKEDKLLVSEDAASSLLSLAAQIALKVKFIAL